MPPQSIRRLSEVLTPTMVAAYARGIDGNYEEASCGFIVPDDWPERSLAYAASPLTTI